MSKAKQGIFLSLIFVVGSITMQQYAFAYRPFVSTDADVNVEKEWEIELGVFNVSHDEGKNEILVPSLRVNYGIFKNWEFVGEFDVQVHKEGSSQDGEIKDPALFLKGVLHEGILQGQQGASFAVELGVLLPSTIEGERDAGLEGIAILSGKISDLVYHLNLGVELDREDFAPNGIWGVILEYPFEGKLRAVGEVNGVVKRHGSPDNSGLIGFIWEMGIGDMDFGLRKGFSNAAPDWELTTGITFSF
ncbi:MAG: hypothetical protein ACUZ77_08255 [Candidatus Brocadiales bacterium]